MRIQELIDRTKNAFSFHRYGEQNWRATASMLRANRYNDRQIESVLRSKYTRWAADRSNAQDGKVTAKDFESFMVQSPSLFSHAAIAELVDLTFPVA